MKKLICALMAALMLLSLSLAGAEETLSSYTLVEKLVNQLAVDGFMAGVRIRAEGEGEWVKTLEPITGKEFRLTLSRQEDALYACIYRYADGESFGLTELYTQGEDAYLRSDFLMDTVLRLPRRDDVYTSLSQIGQAGNPSLLSFAASLSAIPLSSWDEKWDPALEPLRQSLEVSLSKYAKDMAIVSENGANVIVMTYEMSAAQVKQEAVTFLSEVLVNEDLCNLLRRQMTEEQAAIYLQPGLLWYYNREIEALPLEGTLTIERHVSPQGNELSTVVTMPLPEKTGFETARLESRDGSLSLTLTGGEKEWTLISRVSERGENGCHYQGDIFAAGFEGKTFAASYDVSAVVTNTVDDSQISHQITTWTLNLTQNAELAPDAEIIEFEPMVGRVRTNLYSSSNRRGPCTLEVQSSFTLPGGSLSATVKLVIVESDEITPFDLNGAIDLAQLSEDQRSAYLADFIANALLSLTDEGGKPEELPLPDEGEPETETTAEPEEQTEAEPETPDQPETETPEVPETETPVEPEAETETETEPETEPEIETEPEPETEAEPESEETGEPETEPEPVAEEETEPTVETEQLETPDEVEDEEAPAA
ncbi:MAG: hypothetical protein IKP40_13290 [Clostridia bacterium]|nr:hypothetical protein [Clostridia bacterium]